MRPEPVIRSRQNPVYKQIRSLLRRDRRHQERAFLVEGPRFIVDAGEEARKRAPELNLPVAMFIAGDDTYVDKRGAQEFFARLKPGIGEYHEYAGFFHEVFNEIEQDKPLCDLEAWLEKI